jgi:hypothetical protein
MSTTKYTFENNDYHIVYCDTDTVTFVAVGPFNLYACAEAWLNGFTSRPSNTKLILGIIRGDISKLAIDEFFEPDDKLDES